MKGTIDASLPDAENTILRDEKEMAEHATIVDLLRNDLSMVAEEVRVTNYRYVERINTMQQDLLQVSSEITGRLPVDYKQHLGDILFALLPAGSICGAPKIRTLDIISQAEGYDRGFYTGVCGYFDGESLDSAVMIRFLEQTDNGLVYKSGGGITFQSELDKEYEELIQKVYVPVS
jgi:para-aminobenzoate synthetase component 1